jgi:hypothetical protein
LKPPLMTTTWSRRPRLISRRQAIPKTNYVQRVLSCGPTLRGRSEVKQRGR